MGSDNRRATAAASSPACQRREPTTSFGQPMPPCGMGPQCDQEVIL